MPFDANGFLSEKFEDRTGALTIEALRPWYKELPEGESPVWTMRGLTGTDLAAAEEAATKGRTATAAIMETLKKAQRLEGIDELERALGVDKKVPLRLALKLEHVVRGVVDPPITLQVAVKLAAVRATEFEMIHQKIMELTGIGQVALKKPEASGTAPTSEEPC